MGQMRANNSQQWPLQTAETPDQLPAGIAALRDVGPEKAKN